MPTAATGSVEWVLADADRLLETDPKRAAEQLATVLRADKANTHALRLLAKARSRQGELQGALEILVPLARVEPSSAIIQLELGVVLGAVERRSEAVASIRLAAKLQPELPQVWRVLADHLKAAGRPLDADCAYMNHVRHSTHDAQLMEAAGALTDERLEVAERLLRERLKRAPTDVAAIRMLAEVAARLGRNEDALALLERCLELAPSFDAARENYALVLHRSNQPDKAMVEIDRLLARTPDRATCLNLKAGVLCSVGEYGQAAGIYAALAQRYPDHAKLWLSYGHALKTAGHVGRAVAAYRRCVTTEQSFGEGWWSLANLKTFRFGPGDLTVMRRELERKDLSNDDRLHLHFAVGKALEDEGNYELSFQHYTRGNAIRHEQLHYDAEDTSERVRRIRDRYTQEFFVSRAGAGSPACDPIFIVGLPRTGSTLLEQILSSHSMVEGTMELPEITSITRMLRVQADAGSTIPYHDTLATFDDAALHALGERYLTHTRIHRKSGAPRFIDKMPNNFMHVGLIHLILPNAKIIDARRHPMACGFSLFKQHFARGQAFSYDLSDIGRYYRDYVALMSHMDTVLPGQIHRVEYERMVEDTENEVRRLLEYCGLPFEDGCLRFFRNHRPVRTASSEQVRQPIYRDSIDHWRHYARWLGRLEAALGDALAAYPDAADRA